MNQHLRFDDGSACTRVRMVAVLTAGALLLPLLNSCGSLQNFRLSLQEGTPPKLAGDRPFLRYQCYYFTVPDGFELLKATEDAHLAGVYSPEGGSQLVEQLKQKRGFELVSMPSVTCKNNEEGHLKLTREFTYPTEYEAPQTGKGAGESGGIFPVIPATPTKFETRTIGVEATFKGRQMPGGELDFKFDIERTAFLGFVNYGSPIATPVCNLFGRQERVTVTENRIEMPVFGRKQLSSHLVLSSGQYVAIGGLKVLPQPALEGAVRPDSSWGASPDGLVGKDQNLFVLIKVEAVSANKEVLTVDIKG